MNPNRSERMRRFARALGQWSQEPPRRAPREAADRLRVRMAEEGAGSRALGALVPARWLVWGAAGAVALVAFVVAQRPGLPPEAPPSPVAGLVNPGAFEDSGTVVVHELSSGTRIYLALAAPTPR